MTDQNPEQITVLVVPADSDEPITSRSVSPAHATFTGLVEDYNTDTVFFTDADALAYVAETGKQRTTHEHNPRATQVVERFHPGFAQADHIEGPAVVVGTSTDGTLTDVPDEVRTFVTNLFGITTQA